jgi:hypothetical protein
MKAPLYQGDLILEEAGSEDEEIDEINKDLTRRESTAVAELNLSSLYHKES